MMTAHPLPYSILCLIPIILQSNPVDAFALPDLKRQVTTPIRKAGLGWGGGGNISQFEGHEVSWYFTWSPQTWVTPPPKALEFVPQLWGNRDAATFAGVINASSIASNGWEHVLGMNEPQEPTQANLSPQDAANIWKIYLEPLKAAGVRIGSPATTSAPNGKTWLQEFLDACGGCTVDFVALHWYGNVAEEFISYLEDFHNTFQRPIWVTEYSCQNFVNGAQCTYEEIVQFLNTTKTYMDQTAWVERYAWFGAMAALPAGVNRLTALMDPSGVINDLGRQYIGEPATQPTPTIGTSGSIVSTPMPTTSPLTTSTNTLTTITSSISSSSTTTSSSMTASVVSFHTTSTVPTQTPTSTAPPYVIINGAPVIAPHIAARAIPCLLLLCLIPSL